ncbi:NADP-dependent phosphogluconate dehydrogenase [Ancrocorticia populi]|nr:NADP-dependent phosphogluconate dehydrogenase [Ancrocorticia populi]
MECPIGVVGTGVMGASLARNLERNLKQPIAIFDLNQEKVDVLLAQHPEADLRGFSEVGEFVGSLKHPQVVLLMVPAGKPVEAALASLCAELEPGAMVIDGGNTHYIETEKHIAYAAQHGIKFIGMGVSGGEQGALWGPSLMLGGDPSVWEALKPLLEPIAAKAEDGQPCVTLVGSGASGHFTKMVHNGIEYADIELISEAYTLLRSAGLTTKEVATELSSWNQGKNRSFLLESAVEVLSVKDPTHEGSLVDHILDQAKGKGTGAWTVMAGADYGVAVSIIGASTFVRSASSAVREREAWLHPEGEQTPRLNVSPTTIRDAYFTARLIAYQQGMSLLAAASAENNWGINLADISRIWRAGCIIRAGFLGDISAIYENDPESASFTATEPFRGQVIAGMHSLRQTVAGASLAAIPIPALATSLNHQTLLETPRLSTALVQLLRDYFGAHTFERTDAAGSFHIVWEDDRQQIQTSS